MTDRRRLPEPPPDRRQRAAARHVRGHVRVRHRRRHRVGQGDRDRSSPGSARRLVIASRKPTSTSTPASTRSTALGAEAINVPVRHPRTGADRRRCSTPPRRAFGLPDVLINNAAGQLPRAGGRRQPQRLAHGGRHHVERHVLLLPRVRAPPPRGRRRRARSSTSARTYAWTGGPGFVHSAAAKAGVKNLTESLAVEWGPYGIQVNGLVPGMFPHDDKTADILSAAWTGTAESDGGQPAFRVGPSARARLGGDVPRVAVRVVHLRAHDGGRRRQLAAPRRWPTRRSSPSATRWARIRSPSPERLGRTDVPDLAHGCAPVAVSLGWRASRHGRAGRSSAPCWTR